MAAFADGADAIKARLIAQWPNADVPLYWANDNAVQKAFKTSTLKAFVHIDIVAGAKRTVTRGAPGQNLKAQSGEIIARVFTVSGKGVDDARHYGDDIAAIFEDQILDNVHCDQGSSLSGGGDDARDGNWFQMDAIIPFTIFFFG